MRKYLLACLLFISVVSFAQNVGIGTLTPSEKLDVNGNVNVNKETEDTYDKLFLQNYALQFLPCFIKIEVIILYGCYEIYKHSSRLFIVKNFIPMNEKINFNKILVIYI